MIVTVGRRSGPSPRLSAAAAAVLGLWLALATAATPARADLSLVFDQSSYTVANGDTLNVVVSLNSTGADESNLQTWGLYTAGVQVTIPNTLQLTSITPPAYTNFTYTYTDSSGTNTITNFLSSDTVGGTLDFSLFANALASSSSPGELPTPDANGNIVLGTFSFTALASSGSSPLGVIVDPNQGGNAFLDGNPDSVGSLDASITSGTATVEFHGNGVIIPEPSSCLTALTGAVLWLGYAWRRRRARA